jgi:hypothetical protein
MMLSVGMATATCNDFTSVVLHDPDRPLPKAKAESAE